MTAHSIYWHEGMFMWPHHMQQEERFRARQLALHSRYNLHYNWGLRSIDVDTDALKNQRLVIRGLRARLRDGTLIAAPEDCPLPELDLKDALAGRDQLTIHLGVPMFKENQPNAPEPTVPVEEEQAPGLKTRHLVDTVEVADENTSGDLQPLQVRSLNVCLLMDTQDLTGFERLPILRVQKAPGNETQIQLDATYIPSLLACDAWPALYQQILQDQYHRFGSDMESLANQVISRGISFDTRNSGDEELLGQLTVLNEAHSTLNTIAFAEGVHPFHAYLELCRIVGQLAIYQPARRVPVLPRYDHDDLGFCFSQVRQQLEAFKPRRAEYVERVFVGEKLRMQVAVERSWLEPVWQMFVGVQSQLPAEKVIRLFKPGQLDMKIGSGDRVDEVFERGLPGLKFTPVDRVPRALPPATELTYFQVDRESRAEEWANVQKSLTLAIRFNQKRVVVNPQGTLQGQTEVALLNPSAVPAPPTTLKFSLFVVA